MYEPALIVRRDDRDASGNLRREHLGEMGRTLRASGFVLLPSDTAYSIAAWLDTAQIRDQINTMLNRDDDPISLAFPSLDLVKEWTEPNRVAELLFERFTPGPITVVCRASRLIPAEVAEEAWRSQNRTIGIRIPNSAEEQQVAEAERTPVTTVAVRNASRQPVTSFTEAVEIVREGMERIGGAPWCAIEGDIQYTDTSSVVEPIGEDGRYVLHREGVIKEPEILACIADAVTALREG
jgi:L-threonylcarbamoyladenylate synthase